MDMDITRYEWIGFYKQRIFKEGGLQHVELRAGIDGSTPYMEYISFKIFKFSLRGSHKVVVKLNL